MCRYFGRKIDGWLARKLRMTTNGIYAAEAAHCDLGPDTLPILAYVLS